MAAAKTNLLQNTNTIETAQKRKARYGGSEPMSKHRH